ncbi:ribonuclease Z [Novosphingobium kunmingense]|uniref:Ribonuclease Z n=1 Tax=Novosphingobium kunmingense TaxID=1211806 RepID=A0A2N0I1T6_9SPHN|nr:MBL fold metallo-hydrolase [Novosphingobium kunmingense]PKB25147.1 ribonuclease Z [Novosphingobium kunmingense]
MKRRFGLALGGLVLGLGLSLFLARIWVAERLFHAAIDRTVGIDQSGALPDGLHAYVCGSGSPMPDAARAGPCIAILAGQQAFVFDSGAGSIRKLGRMGFPMEKLQGAFLTHLHSDHIDGLGELMLQAWIAGRRSAPLPVHGPEGTGAVVAGFTQAYRPDRGFRIAHHGPLIARPDGFGAVPVEITIPPGASKVPVYAKDGVQITAIRVNHSPISPAFGYRIDYRERSIVISGDTVNDTNLVAASKGTDLLFHEALNRSMVEALGAKLKERGHADTAQIMSDIRDYHATPEDAARAAKQAGAKALVLYHLVPAPPSRLIEPLFLGNAPEIYPDVKLAHDGMIVTLPAGSKDVRFGEGF